MAVDMLAKALAAVSRKDRTEHEMRVWLEAREVEGHEIDRILGYLVENLAIDDRRYARLFTQDKRELSGWGRDRIRDDLIRRGISRDVIDEAVYGGDRDSEVDRAVKVLIERGAELDHDRGRQRALGLLARRGYGADEAYAAIRIAGRAA